MFHLKVHHAVERILVIKNNELVGEMQYVTAIEENTEKVRVFNGTADGEMVIALIVGSLGSTKTTCDKLFSRPLSFEKNDEYVNNFVLINWSKPSVELPVAEVCILDFPKSLTEILDIPPFMIIPKFELPEGTDPEDAQRRGFDTSAEGYFVKPIRHKWPKDEETLTFLQNEPAKVSLYQKMIFKKITPE